MECTAGTLLCGRIWANPHGIRSPRGRRVPLRVSLRYFWVDFFRAGSLTLVPSLRPQAVHEQKRRIQQTPGFHRLTLGSLVWGRTPRPRKTSLPGRPDFGGIWVIPGKSCPAAAAGTSRRFPESFVYYYILIFGFFFFKISLVVRSSLGFRCVFPVVGGFFLPRCLFPVTIKPRVYFFPFIFIIQE